MSNVIKDTLNQGDIVTISESLTKDEEEEQEQESVEEESEDQESVQEESEDQESVQEESEEGEEGEEGDEDESFIKPQVNQDIKQDKSKKKNNEELVSLFRENINKLDNSKLDKSKLEILEKNLNTITDYKYFNNAIL